MEMTNKNHQRTDISLLLEDLKRLESHTEELWHFLPIPACLANPIFNIVNASKALEERSGYKDLEITGENLNELLENFEKIKKELNIKETISGKEAIVDSYKSLKKLIRDKFGEKSKLANAVNELEKEPNSKVIENK